MSFCGYGDRRGGGRETRSPEKFKLIKIHIVKLLRIDFGTQHPPPLKKGNNFSDPQTT